VILSKEWINPDRVRAVLDVLGLEFNKEKTYVGTAAKGFEFVGFYFQEIVDEKGLEKSIKIIPTEVSIEKVIESIECMGCAGKARFDDKNNNRAPDIFIKNIYKVVDPWVNYYRHTDYAAGLERIKQSVNKRRKEFT